MTLTSLAIHFHQAAVNATIEVAMNETIVVCHGSMLIGNGVEAFLYCQLEGAVGDETVTLARQQSTDIFILVR